MPASTLAFHSRARSLASADGHERAFAVLYLETIDIISVARFLDQKIQSDSSTNRCESHFFYGVNFFGGKCFRNDHFYAVYTTLYHELYTKTIARKQGKSYTISYTHSMTLHGTV